MNLDDRAGREKMGNGTRRGFGAWLGVAERGGVEAVRIGRLALALVVSLAVLLAFAIRADADIFWTNYEANTIGRANDDGTALNQSFVTGATGPNKLALNNTHLYWANHQANTIGRANVDGTGLEQSFITGADGLFGLAVDDAHIYWGNVYSGTIGRANLDGTGVDQSFMNVGVGVTGVLADESYIYFSNFLTNAIGRASLDGTGIDPTFIAPAGIPYGLAIHDGQLYWANSGGSIGRANLDGTGVDIDFISGLGGPTDVAVDDSYIYWPDGVLPGAAVGRANLDGSDVNRSFIATASSSYGVEVLLPPAANVSPGQLSFGELVVGTTSPPRALMVRNAAGSRESLTIGTAAIIGADASSFAIAGDGCSGTTLAPGDDCTVSVVMTPPAPGGKAASLSIPSNDPDGPVTIPLAGTGVPTVQPPPPPGTPGPKPSPQGENTRPPNLGTAVFDGRNLYIRISCSRRYRPRCRNTVVAIDRKRKPITARARSSIKAGKSKIVKLRVKPRARRLVARMAETPTRKRLRVRRVIRAGTLRGDKKRTVVRTYRVLSASANN